MADEEANSGWGSDREQSIRSWLSQRQVPEGQSVGSFTNYANAQAVVDLPSNRDESSVPDLAIVGIGPTQVERVVGRLAWPKVLGDDTLYGSQMGLFLGLVLGSFQEGWMSLLIVGLGMGAIFGIVLVAVLYTMQNGKRDFSTTTEIVARRCDALCNPRNAEHVHDLLTQRALGGNRG